MAVSSMDASQESTPSMEEILLEAITSKERVRRRLMKLVDDSRALEEALSRDIRHEQRADDRDERFVLDC